MTTATWLANTTGKTEAAAGTAVTLRAAQSGASTKLTVASGLVAFLQNSNALTLTQATANASVLTSTGYSLTGSNAQSLVDLAGTWNTSGTPTAIKLNITNTASGASSNLMDLQVGGASVYTFPASGVSWKLGSLSASASANMIGGGFSAANNLHTANGTIGLGGSQGFNAQGDVVLNRDAADTLAQRRTTNAQTFRTYGSYTDTSNYTRLALGHNGTSAFLSEQVAGTGTPGGIAISAAALASAQATSLLDMSQTWNTTGTPTALKLNVTDTASNAASLLMDLQVGATSVANVTKAGIMRSTGIGPVTGTSMSIAANTVFTGASTLFFDFTVYGGAGTLAASRSSMGNGFKVGSAYGYEFSSTTSANGTPDLTLFRDAADTLAQRRGTNAQAFRLYSTYTDASNLERGFLKWDSSVFKIGTEKAGTGSARAMEFQTDGTTRLTIAANGAATFSSGITTSGSITRSSRFSLVAAVASDGNLALRASDGSAGATLNMKEMTAPSAPSADQVYLYAEDNGSGKTRLMALFATGAAVEIAIEP